MTEKSKKGNILNVRIPASAIVGENKKSVLIGTNTITFWLVKDFCHKNKLSDFMQCYNIGIVDTWNMKYTTIADGKVHETTGLKLATSLDKFFKIYNFVAEKEKTDLIDDAEIVNSTDLDSI